MCYTYCVKRILGKEKGVYPMEKEPEMHDQQDGQALTQLLEVLADGNAAPVCAQLAGVLVGPCPEALTLLLQEKRLAPYGLPGDAFDRAARPERVLLPLKEVPAVPLLRWWALLRLTEAFVPRVAAAFGWDGLLVRRLAQLDDWYCGGMPQGRSALKHRLQSPLPVEAADAFAAFAALSAEYAQLPAAYQALLDSGEPFRLEHLRITVPELMAEGVPCRKLERVRGCLLESVLDAPELNVWPTLAQMARSLRHLV